MYVKYKENMIVLRKNESYQKIFFWQQGTKTHSILYISFEVGYIRLSHRFMFITGSDNYL